MTVRFASNQQVTANHYNPDLMTAPADISINGAPAFHVNFANSSSRLAGGGARKRTALGRAAGHICHVPGGMISYRSPHMAALTD